MTIFWLILWAIFGSPPLNFAEFDQGHPSGWLLFLIIAVAMDLSDHRGGS